MWLQAVKINKAIEAEFFYGAKPEIFELARALRKNMTEAEKVLWKKINNRQLYGVHFRRQHPVNKFIADFYSNKAKLVIETDGGIHSITEHKEYDEGRDYFMNELGLTVLRFTNDEVIYETDTVVETIKETIRKNLKLVQE